MNRPVVDGHSALSWGDIPLASSTTRPLRTPFPHMGNCREHVDVGDGPAPYRTTFSNPEQRRPTRPYSALDADSRCMELTRSRFPIMSGLFVGADRTGLPDLLGCLRERA
jgi:hypothetical protein